MANGNFRNQNSPEFDPKEGFNFSPPDEGFDSTKITSERQDPKTGGLSILIGNLSGVHIQGYYDGKYPVVTFLYHKTNAEGEFETTPRTVMVTGIYEGEHPDHSGQGSDIYLHGIQVNDPNDKSGESIIPTMDQPTSSTNTKNFALNSIYTDNKTVIDARTGTRQFIPPNHSKD